MTPILRHLPLFRAVVGRRLPTAAIYGSGDESDKSKKESGVKSDDEDESDCDSDESCPEGCVCWNCKAEREETEDK